MAAADGFRLSVRKAQLSTPVSKPVSAIVPARALGEVARIASDGGAAGGNTVAMILPPGRGQVIFRLPDVEIVSQLIDGNFPDYEQIIPRRCDTRAILSTASFSKACKQAEIFAREGSHIARVNITPGSELTPGQVEISGQSEETGFSQNVVDASIEGPALLIAFNVRFLREVLDVVKTPNVALETTSETSPGVIRPVGGAEGQDGFLHVIMPMHLGS
jgi:DNA polymerase-3 subunit beta